ncbi:MAG: Ada metal-binding domain-containing protein [Candidatus Altiarchaeota archaeon]|nr:Ada metal-binding domain-containing protein [Candidatus Altiarchaeota archaeon]
MDTKILFILLIGGLVLTSGCVSEKKMYVCFDGSIVSDSRECPREEAEKIIVTRYVCSGGEVVNKTEDCPEIKPQQVTVTKYVCPDGFVVDNAGECLTTTTVMMGVTSTTIGLGTTTSSSTSSTTSTTEETKDDCRFVGSINGGKYHYPDCPYAKRIKPENLICFSDEKDAQEQGYLPCMSCKPPT